MINQTFQQKLQNFFDSYSLGNTIYQIFINGLIVFSVVLLLMEHHITKLEFTHRQFVIADIIIASIFAIEYILRFHAAAKKFKFAVNIYNVIDLVAIVPSFIIVLYGGEASTAPLRVLRFLRFSRFLRIARLFRVVKIINELEKKYKEDYKKDSEAYEEVAYYDKLYNFYTNLQNSKNTGISEKELASLIKETGIIARNTNNLILGKSKIRVTEEKQNFFIAFYELLSQIKVLLKRFGKSKTYWNMIKLDYLIKELGVLLQAEHTKGTVRQPEHLRLTKSMHFLRLSLLSFRDIIIVFAVAIALNVILKITTIYDKLFPYIDPQLAVIEAGMAGLIVFITSFNLSYTNSKRGSTDMAVIDFTNLLVVYSEAIRSLISEREKNARKREHIYEELNHYFENIGFEIINGVKIGNKYHLRFDTVILQCLDRINFVIGPYLVKTDDVTRNYITGLHGNLLGALNHFQTIANIRSAVIFNTLNDWMIQITYFLITIFSSYSALPRLFIVYFMQRAFYNTAHETDQAIFNVSLSRLPVDERVLRRICRISSVLS